MSWSQLHEYNIIQNRLKSLSGEEKACVSVLGSDNCHSFHCLISWNVGISVYCPGGVFGAFVSYSISPALSLFSCLLHNKPVHPRGKASFGTCEPGLQLMFIFIIDTSTHCFEAVNCQKILEISQFFAKIILKNPWRCLKISCFVQATVQNHK